MRTLKCDPQTELVGQVMLSIIENLEAENITPFLEKHHLQAINPEEWYPAQRFLDVLNDMAASPDGMANMVAVGMAVADKMITPPELEHAPLGTILSLWNDLYHLQHRGGEIGYVKTEQLSETHYRTTHVHLYPDDFTYGLAYGMARRFLPKGTAFKVFYDPNTPHLDEGGEVTIIDVKWG